MCRTNQQLSNLTGLSKKIVKNTEIWNQKWNSK